MIIEILTKEMAKENLRVYRIAFWSSILVALNAYFFGCKSDAPVLNVLGSCVFIFFGLAAGGMIGTIDDLKRRINRADD